MGSRAKRETDLTIAIDRVRSSGKEEPSDHSRWRMSYRMRTWADLVMSQHCLFEDHAVYRNFLRLPFRPVKSQTSSPKACFDSLDVDRIVMSEIKPSATVHREDSASSPHEIGWRSRWIVQAPSCEDNNSGRSAFLVSLLYHYQSR
jgi:hypothetical protein